MTATLCRHALLRRSAASALVVLLLWLSPGMPGWRQCYAQAGAGPRIPLALIGEPERDGGEVPHDFIAACEREGYVSGQTLYEVNPGLLADLTDGAAIIAEFVNQCSAKAPAGRVDIIACGVSGLVARLALEAGMISDRTVQNLVMVAAPNRGTFLADLLKSIVDIAKHESLFEKESRAWRYLPTGEELLSLFLPPAGDDEVDYSRLSDPQDMEWDDETAWVAERVRQVYEPLYARYVEARYSVLPYIPAESPKETFAGWICRTMPQFWDSAVKKGVLPPDGSPIYPSGGPSVAMSAPPPGRDLSSAYYEVLSMEVAKNQYVMRLASKGSVVETVLKQPYIPAGWKDALIHYGTRVLQYYARKALLTVKAELQEAAVNQVVRQTGFIEDSESPLLRRLIKDDLVVNLGTSIAKRFERLPANTYLAALNGASYEASLKRKTRYISVAAKLASPWNLVWPQLGPNDFFLEVDSTVAPPGPRDRQRVFGGLFSPSGEGLLESKDVQGWVFSLLSDDSVAPALLAGNTPGAKLAISSWGPTYIQADGTSKALAVTLPDPPAGWQFQAWSEGYREGSRDGFPQCAAFRFLSTGGTYTLDASLGRLGLRLARTGLLNPVQGTTVSSAYAAETRAEVAVSTADPGSLPVAVEEPGEVLPPSTAPDPAMPGYPLVRVINRSKQTTHEQPKETYHGFWVIDYGDGDVQRVDGSPSLDSSHTFQAGSYKVEAQSFDNRGDPLLLRTWKLSVDGAKDAERQFSCRSIPRPNAELALTGPVMWVTGKPAVFSAELKLELPANVEVVFVEYDPGPKFCVLWERSGDFQVACAATVRLRYLLESETPTVENTYLSECTVSVLTTGVTR